MKWGWGLRHEGWGMRNSLFTIHYSPFTPLRVRAPLSHRGHIYFNELKMSLKKIRIPTSYNIILSNPAF